MRACSDNEPGVRGLGRPRKSPRAWAKSAAGFEVEWLQFVGVGFRSRYQLIKVVSAEEVDAGVNSGFRKIKIR